MRCRNVFGPSYLVGLSDFFVILYMICRSIIHSVVLVVVLTQICQLPTTFDCLDINVCQNATVIFSVPGTVYECPQTLVLMADTLNITGEFTSIELCGNSI